jgi:hypothetical protein
LRFTDVNPVEQLHHIKIGFVFIALEFKRYFFMNAGILGPESLLIPFPKNIVLSIALLINLA